MNSQELTKAITLLRFGSLVAIPTETVYGLAADARNPLALRKIFQAKERPIDHPLIVHIGDIVELPEWAIEISDSALLLAKTYWPGPLTLILKKAPGVSDLLTGNQETIGVRMPNHPLTRELLRLFGHGVAAPSANRFGRISPTTAEAVREELGDAVDLILDGGMCAVGVESTIVDVTGNNPVILRPGMISAEEISAVLKKPVIITQQNSPRVSGSLESHYAPKTKAILIQPEHLKIFLQTLNTEELPIALLVRNKILFDNNIIYLMPNDPKKYAHDLYQALRELDKKNVKKIVIEAVPDQPEWDAVRDRLMRACGS